MAQVRKFQSGGTPQLFNVGNRQINKEDFVYLAKKNLGTYMANNNITGEEAGKLENSVNDIISKINNNEINTIDIDGSLIDPTNTVSSDSGNAVNYLNDLASYMTTYKAPTKEKYSKKRNRFWNIFTDDYFGGTFQGDADELKAWNEDADWKNKLVGYLKTYRGEIDKADYDWGDTSKEKELDKIDNAISAIESGNIDISTARSLMAIGVPLRLAKAILGLPLEEASTEAPVDTALDTLTLSFKDLGLSEDDAKQMAELQLQQQRKQVKETIENAKIVSSLGNYETGDNLDLDPNSNYSSEGNYSNSRGVFDNVAKALQANHPFTLADYINTTINKHSDKPATVQATLHTIIAALDSFAKQSTTNKYMTDVGGGKYVLNNYFNPLKNRMWIYDSKTHKIYSEPIYSSEEGANNQYFGIYKKHIAKKAEGGILFALKGAVTDYAALAFQSYKNEYSKKQKAIEALKLQNQKKEAAESGWTLELYQHNNTKLSKDKLTKADWARVAATAGDIAGLIAAIVPGGSAAAAALGYGSDIIRLGADIADGQSWKKTLANFGSGLMWSTISAIPIAGAAGKMGKVVKTMRTFMPILLTSYSGFSQLPETIKAWERINNNKGTVGDFKTILTFITAASNATKATSSAVKVSIARSKRQQMNSDGTPVEEITVRGKKGNIKLKADLLLELTSKGNKAEMNEYLRALGIDDELDFRFGFNTKPTGGHFYNRGVSVTKSPEYDWEMQVTDGFMPKLNQWDVNFMKKGFFNISLPKIKLPNIYNYGSPAPRVVTPNVTPVTSAPVVPKVTPNSTVNPSILPTSGSDISPIPMKKGGILKAQDGLSVYKEKIYDDKDTTWDMSQLYGIHPIESDGQKNYTKGQYSNKIWETTGKGSSTSTYGSRKNESEFGNMQEAINLEKSDLYKAFTEQLIKSAKAYQTNKNSEDAKLFREWAKKVDDDANIQEDAKFFDKNGELHTQWVVRPRNNNWNNANNRDATHFTTAADYIKHLRNDHDWALRHNDFVRLGTRYYIKNADGNKKYIDISAEDAAKFNPLEDKEYIWEGNIRWKDILLSENPNAPKTVGTHIESLLPQQPEIKTPYDYNETIAKLGSLGKFIYILRKNKEIEDAALQKDIAAYKNPYLKEAPVVNVYNLEANKTRQQGELNSTGRDILQNTADALTGINARLQASKQQAEVGYKYDSAIDEKIENNKAQQVAITNENRANENEVANYNRQVGVSKHDADIDVSNARRSADLQNVQNYMDEKILEAKLKSQDYKSNILANMQKIAEAQFKQNMSNLASLQTQYQQALDDKNENLAAALKLQIESKLREYYNTYYNTMGAVNARLHGLSWSNIPSYKAYDMITPKHKKGGTLEDNRFKARLKDNERFDKGILKMIETNRKAIENSSALTRAIIIKFIK